MDRKPIVESNYPRENSYGEPAAVPNETSLIIPLVVIGMMVGTWTNFPHRGGFWVVFGALVLILGVLIYKIVWVERQFWVYVDRTSTETVAPDAPLHDNHDRSSAT